MTTAEQTTAINTSAPKPTLATKKEEILVGTMTQIQRHIQEGKLHLPPDYSVENAIQTAWLILSEGDLLNSCNTPSIINALRLMSIQGLDPSKKHCYFIGYGKSLQCQRSYFGDMMVAERAKPGIEFYYSVIREGDAFEVEMVRGKKSVLKHTTAFANADNAIIGAYCGYIDKDGVDQGVTVMTMKDIKTSWGQSKVYKEGGNGTHQKFEEEMTLRTVIRKCCKPIINSSNDSLLMAAIAESQMDSIDAEFSEVADAESMSEEITMDAEPEAEADEERIGKAPTDQVSGDPGF
jgi:recombination protein RecT